MSSVDVKGQICLRHYQLAAAHEIQTRILQGARRILVVAPTGSGKTVLFAHLTTQARARGLRVLIVAHRRELIHQACAKVLSYGLDEADVGVVMASDPRRRPAAGVQVASVDTLRYRTRPRADLVIIDECHRATAKSYRELSDAYPAAVHLGFTATPYRSDGRGLGEVYDEIVVAASIGSLIAEGHLVEPRVFTVPTLPDLSKVRVRGGDYDERSLAEAVNTTSLVGDLIEHWKTHAGGVRTVAFAVSVEHSRHIADRFRAAGIAAEHLDGGTPTAERDGILARLASGTTRVVANCNCLSEGFDLPSVKCAILARPTKSAGLYLQQAGRILRPHEGLRAVILDHAGCAAVHGLPQDEREFSLDGVTRRGTGRDAPSRTCPECFAVLPASTTACPECGFTFPGKELVPEENEGTLVEVVPTARPSVPDARRVHLEQLRALARAQRRDEAWVSARYAARYGELPPSDWAPSAWGSP
jgi:superfamily II DNA or RNA helicase